MPASPQSGSRRVRRGAPMRNLAGNASVGGPAFLRLEVLRRFRADDGGRHSRLIAGLERIAGDTVRIDHRPVNDLAPRDRDIAMVFQ